MPGLLSEGARVAVVAPAGVFEPERLEAGIALASSWGLALVPSPHLGARHRYTAGTRAVRASDLHWALTAPDIDAVWFARGGYGTVHCLPSIPWHRLDGRPVIGFSDATALFSACRARSIGGAVHGPVLHSLADHCDGDTVAALRRLLLEDTTVTLPCAGPTEPISAPLVGGNLCVLASLAGTPWLPPAEGAIVVLEEIGEVAYRIDRLLTQLVECGYLGGARAVVLGELRNCQVPAGATWTVEDVARDVLGAAGLVVHVGLPVGHGPANRPWRHGAAATLGSGGIVQDPLDVG